jgi:hypothetical protein
MTAHLDDATSDPQKTIAELRRKLNERTSERDEALAQQTATAVRHGLASEKSLNPKPSAGWSNSG